MPTHECGVTVYHESQTNGFCESKALCLLREQSMPVTGVSTVVNTLANVPGHEQAQLAGG